MTEELYFEQFCGDTDVSEQENRWSFFAQDQPAPLPLKIDDLVCPLRGGRGVTARSVGVVIRVDLPFYVVRFASGRGHRFTRLQLVKAGMGSSGKIEIQEE